MELLPVAKTTCKVWAKSPTATGSRVTPLSTIRALWQAYRGRRGIEQFWVIFFLFFMTGIAIVLYLNQTPSQPRERDYAYAGSFYAYCIWVGMGVAGLWSLVMWALKKNKKQAKGEAALASDNGNRSGVSTAIAGVAALIGLIIPLQMVSQTWDDHDRSGRYAARDFGRNYLSSVAKNGVIFCNGDNDTFRRGICRRWRATAPIARRQPELPGHRLVHQPDEACRL